MHRAGTAERDEREVTRLDPLGHGQRPDCLRHLRVDHVEDSLRELERLERKLACEAGDGASGGSGVERHPAAGERRRVDPAEDEIRIGDGRLAAAPPVARGAGVGTRALRADAEPAALLVRDGAATGADGVDVHDRHQERQALEGGLRRDLGAAVDDEADVEARAAHVDADQIRPLEQARQRDEAHRAAHRPGEQRLHRPFAGRARRDDAAARLHHVQGDVQSALVQLALEPLEVAAHGRAGVRVEHGGRSALVLAPFGGDSVRQRDRKVTELLAQDLLGAQLVRRIEVGEEEADGDGTEGLVLGASGGGTDGLLVERRQLLASPVEPAADLDGVSPRNERRRLSVVELVQLCPVAAGDLVRVADALRGEQQDALASPLKERVQPDGRAVDEEADLGHVLDDLRERGEDAFGQILGRRRGLPCRVGAGVFPVGDDVRERAADVHRDPEAAHWQTLPPGAAPRRPIASLRGSAAQRPARRWLHTPE